MQTTHTQIPVHICRRRIRQCGIGEKVAMPHNDNILVERRSDRQYAIWHGTLRVARISARNAKVKNADINDIIDTVLHHPKLAQTELVGVESPAFLSWVELMTKEKPGQVLKQLNKQAWEDFGSESAARQAVRSLFYLRYGTPQATLQTLGDMPLFAYALRQAS